MYVTWWLREDGCACAFAFTSVILNTEQSRTPGSELCFLGPSMHLSLSSGGPPSLPLASWVKWTSGGGDLFAFDQVLYQV